MYIRIALTGADLASSLRKIAEAGITITDMEKTGAFTILFTMRFSAWMRLRKILSGNGDELKILSETGFLWSIKRMMKRPVLLAGMCLLLMTSIWLPGRILFVEVDGNETLPTYKIVEKAAACGIHFGASRRAVRSEVMKNALLEAMPELQWAGVNTYGCIAKITVRENKIEEEKTEEYPVSSIVALRDGVIRQITVLRGNRLCSVGQAVKTGQVLVSGYNDCGIFIQATAAQAEVFAETVRSLSVVSPGIYDQRQEIRAEYKKISLIIGKKRINFYNSSGILDASCVKIYEQKYMTLPGDFVLPICLVTETWFAYEEPVPYVIENDEAMQTFAREYLCSQMIGGSILNEHFALTELSGAYRLDGLFGCYEMIGLSRPEEILTDYESD